MKVVFIAGPYTGDGSKETIEKNVREAEEYAVNLATLGIGFFCPHRHTAHFSEMSSAPEQFYYDLDMEFLKRIADAILIMPGWENSAGAKREVECAKQLGLKMFFPVSPENLEEVSEWYHE